AGEARIDAGPEVWPSCGDALAYRRTTISHLGAATCPRCGWSNDDAAFLADVETRSGLDSLSMTVAGARCELRLGGIHNAYNAAAAIAAAASLGIPPPEAARALAAFTPKFGRTEELDLDGRRAWLLLMKNPAGAGTLVDQVLADPRVRAVVIMVNDQWADGRDVSW